MNNNLLQIKIKQRLNKLASMDYDNIEGWQIEEAFNKAQIEWVRRQLHGTNATKEGDEQSRQRVDDLQALLTPTPLQGRHFPTFFESERLPFDYLAFKRVSSQAISECCTEPRTMTIYLAEEADADLLLVDRNSEPNFEWAETFCTLFGNKIRIYTNSAFTLKSPKLIYYRMPQKVKFRGVMSPETGLYHATDTESELKDDILELIIDEAAAILAGDIESITQFQRETQQAERNN